MGWWGVCGEAKACRQAGRQRRWYNKPGKAVWAVAQAAVQQGTGMQAGKCVQCLGRQEGEGSMGKVRVGVKVVQSKRARQRE